MAPFTHIIAFKMRDGLSAEEMEGFAKRFLSMEHRCLKDGKPYVAIRGGKQVFPHPPAHGMQIVFIIDYKSKEDEEYFHTHDAYHREFVKEAQAKSADAVILDFAPFAFADQT